MRNILASELNQAEGAFHQLIACSLAGLRQPARTSEKVQDGLPDSKVRMKSALEGLTNRHHKTKQAAPTAVIDVSALPPVMPLPKPKPRSAASMKCSASMTTRRMLLPTVSGTAMLLSTLLALQQLPAMLLPVLFLSGLANQKQLEKTVRLPRFGHFASCFEAKNQAGLYSL